eukprot:4911457-Amphidinium_carterae.1
MMITSAQHLQSTHAQYVMIAQGGFQHIIQFKVKFSGMACYSCFLVMRKKCAHETEFGFSFATKKLALLPSHSLCCAWRAHQSPSVELGWRSFQLRSAEPSTPVRRKCHTRSLQCGRNGTYPWKLCPQQGILRIWFALQETVELVMSCRIPCVVSHATTSRVLIKK